MRLIPFRLVIFYHIFLWLYRLGVFVASFFNPKARLFLKGRVNLLMKVRKEMKHATGRVVWMHCASLGEYEQGKPVLENIMRNYPDVTPVVSFFSPSGYEMIKKKNLYPHVFYLPMDSFINASLWMKYIKPALVLWVKYEYWYFYLQKIRHERIPLLMISGVYTRNQVFFRWYGALYRTMLRSFSHFFVQNGSSKRYLSTLVEKDRITVSGDTRCDRVLEIANRFEPLQLIEKFIKQGPVVVCGSTWEADNAVWIHYVKVHPEIKFIIAPHEVDKENIQTVVSSFTNSITYSNWVNMQDNHRLENNNVNCLVIDNIGMLSRLYHYADITYVGGGFGGSGLHNILEAAVYDKPVLFGPFIYKNFEAGQLIDAGGGIQISTALELEKALDVLFSDKQALEEKGRAAGNYVRKNAGASAMVLDFIKDRAFL